MKHQNAPPDVEDDRWAGLDVNDGSRPTRNPFDRTADPEEWEAWEHADAEAKEAARAQRERELVDQEARRQLINLRGRHRADEKFREEQAEAARAAMGDNHRVHPGGDFLLDAPATPPALWGDGDDILWAHGESLIIAGPQGVGKTTVAGQLMRATCGLLEGHELFGLRVDYGSFKRTGYLAMDRPEQARRNLARLFTEEEREYLNDFLRFWVGPLPTDVATDPETLVRVANQLEVDCLFIDSLKDAAVGLSKDEIGAGYNRARQIALAEGIQLVELHHLVKNSADGRAPKQLRDVYGSTWITSGAGSVILLWGEAGDPIVEFHHLKQPMNEVGPWKILHNRDTGLSTIHYDDETDVVALARRCKTTGISAKEAAVCLYQKDEPTKAEIEKARRKLDKLVTLGQLVVVAADSQGRGNGTRWFAQAPESWSDGSEEWYR